MKKYEKIVVEISDLVKNGCASTDKVGVTITCYFEDNPNLQAVVSRSFNNSKDRVEAVAELKTKAIGKLIYSREQVRYDEMFKKMCGCETVEVEIE